MRRATPGDFGEQRCGVGLGFGALSSRPLNFVQSAVLFDAHAWIRSGDGTRLGLVAQYASLPQFTELPCAECSNSMFRSGVEFSIDLARRAAAIPFVAVTASHAFVRERNVYYDPPQKPSAWTLDRHGIDAGLAGGLRLRSRSAIDVIPFVSLSLGKWFYAHVDSSTESLAPAPLNLVMWTVVGIRGEYTL